MPRIASILRPAIATTLLPLACASFLAPGAQAASPVPALHSQSGADELAAVIKEDAARAERSRRAGALDTTPPVLKQIDVTGSVDAQQVGQSVSVTVKLKDDLSGVVFYEVGFRSPSGTRTFYRYKQVPTPLTGIPGTLTVGPVFYSYPGFNQFMEPGTWVANFFYASDAAGNSVNYSEQQLAALGTTTFTVTNNGGYDIVPPKLASGTIETPTTKLSKPPKGTAPGTPPYVSADVSVTDSGNGAISGTYSGVLYFCMPDGTGSCIDSFSMYGVTNRAGLIANTMTVGTQLRSDQTPGSYEIYYLELEDLAGNYSVLYNQDFGGSTDFHTYFPTGITVFVNQ